VQFVKGRPQKDMLKNMVIYGSVPGVEIELFARQKIPNWDAWGDDPNLQNQPLEIFS